MIGQLILVFWKKIFSNPSLVGNILDNIITLSNIQDSDKSFLILLKKNYLWLIIKNFIYFSSSSISSKKPSHSLSGKSSDWSIVILVHLLVY
jgi:hypothetical protein